MKLLLIYYWTKHLSCVHYLCLCLSFVGVSVYSILRRHRLLLHTCASPLSALSTIASGLALSLGLSAYHLFTHDRLAQVHISFTTYYTAQQLFPLSDPWCSLSVSPCYTQLFFSLSLHWFFLISLISLSVFMWPPVGSVRARRLHRASFPPGCLSFRILKITEIYVHR